MAARMISHASRVLAAMMLALPAVLVPAACTSGTTDCSCFAPGAHVHVAPASAAAVTSITLRGPACDGVATTCVQAAATGCETYSFAPKAAGSCSVSVVFVDGTFTASVTFEQTSGCCAGLYASPSSAGEIDAVRSPADGGAG